MRRLFTQDVTDLKGEIKFREGVVSSDYPKSTWRDIAHSAGLELDEFSTAVDDVGTAAPATRKKRRGKKE